MTVFLFKSLPHLYPCSYRAESLEEELETEKTTRGGHEKKGECSHEWQIREN